MDRQTGEVFTKRLEINRLGKAGIATRLPDALQLFKGSQARDGGNLHVGEMPLFARPVDKREAILLPQADIQKDDIRQRRRCDSYEALFQSLRKDGFVAFGFKPEFEEFAIIGIVIHHKNSILHSVFLWSCMAAGVKSHA